MDSHHCSVQWWLIRPRVSKTLYRRWNHFKMFNPIVPRSTKLPIGHYYLELLPRYAKGTARSHEELYNLVPLGKVAVKRIFRTLVYVIPCGFWTLDPCFSPSRISEIDQKQSTCSMIWTDRVKHAHPWKKSLHYTALYVILVCFLIENQVCECVCVCV